MDKNDEEITTQKFEKELTMNAVLFFMEDFTGGGRAIILIFLLWYKYYSRILLGLITQSAGAVEYTPE